MVPATISAPSLKSTLRHGCGMLQGIDDGGAHHQRQASAHGVRRRRHPEHQQAAGDEEPAAHAEDTRPASSGTMRPRVHQVRAVGEATPRRR